MIAVSVRTKSLFKLPKLKGEAKHPKPDDKYAEEKRKK